MIKNWRSKKRTHKTLQMTGRCASRPTKTLITSTFLSVDLSTVSVFSGVDLHTSHAFASPNRYFCNSQKSAPLPHGCRGDPSKLCNCRHFHPFGIRKSIKNRLRIDWKSSLGSNSVPSPIFQAERRPFWSQN